MSQLIDCTSCGGSGLDSFKTEAGEFRSYLGASGVAERCGTCLGLGVIPGPLQMVDKVSEAIEEIVSDLGTQEPTSPHIDSNFPTAVRAFLHECLIGKFDYDSDDVSEADFKYHTGYYTVEIGGGEWTVMSDSEADIEANEQVWYRAWAFTPSFLAAHMTGGKEVAEATESYRHENCENANESTQALIVASSGKDHFIEDAIKTDGRGHFLSPYDGEELELEWRGDLAAFFAYRQN